MIVLGTIFHVSRVKDNGIVCSQGQTNLMTKPSFTTDVWSKPDRDAQVSCTPGLPKRSSVPVAERQPECTS